MIKKLFLDTETTGVEIQDGFIIEIGFVVDYDNTYEEHILNCKPFDPDYKLTGEAVEKHGLTREIINEFPSSERSYKTLVDILDKHVNRYDKTDKFVVYGYGAEFDVQFLRKFFLENNDKYFGSFFWHPWVDIMTLAMYHLVDQRHRLENFRLSTVAEYLGVSVDNEKLHGALYDAQLCRQVFMKVISKKIKRKPKEDIITERMQRAYNRSQRMDDDIPF